jgi:hypothetical protein
MSRGCSGTKYSSGRSPLQILLLVPSKEVVLALEDDEGWNCSSCCVDALDDCCLLSIALLDALRPFSMLRACNNRSSQYHAHHEARLIKVIGIFIQDAVLHLCVLYKLEPLLNNLRSLAQGSLVVVLAIELDFELRLALNKCTSPVYANLGYMTLSTQRIGHISNSSEPGGEILAYQDEVYTEQSLAPRFV